MVDEVLAMLPGEGEDSDDDWRLILALYTILYDKHLRAALPCCTVVQFVYIFVAPSVFLSFSFFWGRTRCLCMPYCSFTGIVRWWIEFFWWSEIEMIFAARFYASGCYAVMWCVCVYDEITDGLLKLSNHNTMRGHRWSFSTVTITDKGTMFRVITCLENLEMSGNLTDVRVMSDFTKSQWIVREKILPKTVYCKLYICVHTGVK